MFYERVVFYYSLLFFFGDKLMVKKRDLIDIGPKYNDILKSSNVQVFYNGQPIGLLSCAPLLSTIRINGEKIQVYTSQLQILRSSTRTLDKLLKSMRKEKKKKDKHEKEYERWGKDNLPTIFSVELD